ncbi:MAG: MtrB/PioB family decaheme-associated outer membrane protein, partial [Acidiferrobacterales bacterium]|nr:MtrB/PioB family decaheme-associated outer membrane protein [Acidiferrobacterales bacterium]
MNMPKNSILLMVLLSAAPIVTAAEKDDAGSTLPVDTSKWECKFCAFELGHSGYVDAGAGYLSDDSFKFGEYTGLTDEGAYLIGDAQYRYRGKGAHYLDLDAQNLGLDSRWMQVEGGKQGTYELFLDYYELPHFISDSAVTPFAGSGDENLTLRSNWVPAGTTSGMTALNSSLSQRDIETKRRSLGLGVKFFPGSKWQTAIKGRHEIKEGKLGLAGASLFTATQFLQPIDYVTDELDVSATYSGQRFQARVGYYGSMFRNHDDSLTWDNPFTFTGTQDPATEGRLALPPDNQFHQLFASVGYQINKKTRLTADLTAGRGEQDEDFLPYTINSTIAGVQPLPRTSLDGRVDTLTAYVRLNSAISERWQLNAAYKYNDRDNKTPQASYTPVVTDAFLSPTARTNLPYSFTENVLKLSADYRIAKRTTGSLGFDYETVERTFQEVDDTKDKKFWGQFRARTQENVDVLLKVAYADRSISDYTPVPEIFPAQNPLMRIYNMADRQRLSSVLQVIATPREALSVGGGFEFARNDYDRSQIGLLDSREASANLDASVQVSKRTNVHFFLNYQLIESKQAGSALFSTPDWFQNEDDTFNTAGIGFKHMLIK